MNVGPQGHTESDGTLEPAQGVLTRWRWYHFYFILAFFDVIVILASLYLYHRTLKSYEVALADLGRIDNIQRWVADMRLAVIQLNAPGNDVFASRRVAAERARFTTHGARFENLVQQAPGMGIDVTEFRDRVQRMIEVESEIFDIFDSLVPEEDGLPDDADRINSATVLMATMDRHQAHALDALGEIARELSGAQHALLEAYGANLRRSAASEKYFFMVVALILCGVFLYGRRLQRAYEQMTAERQRAIEEKHARLATVGEVCSAVAHGMRNPIASITSSIQLALQGGGLDEKTVSHLTDVLKSSQRLDDRIRRLLDFSKTEKSGLQSCNVSEIIDDAVSAVRSKLDERRITVEVACLDRRLRADGDREWLVQSIIEVLSNSMAHMLDGGRIQISCGCDPTHPDHARIDIKDNGPGIPESIRPHVFDLFFTSRVDGSGIGLASVKRAVEMHGGRVDAKQATGEGAHIEILLPLS